MLNNIVIGKYYNTNSIVHKINPFIKLLLTLIYVIFIMFIENIYAYIILTIIFFIFTLFTKVPLKQYYKSIKGLYILIFSIIIINLIFKTQYINTILMIMKLILTLMYTSMLTMTTTTLELTKALEQLLSPFKYIGINIYSLSFIITLAINFIPSILNQVNKILISLNIKGINYKKQNLKNKLLILKAIILPIFNLSLKKADNTADILDIRLYNIDKKRNNYSKIKIFDIMVLIVNIIIIIIIMKEV